NAERRTPRLRPPSQDCGVIPLEKGEARPSLYPCNNAHHAEAAVCPIDRLPFRVCAPCSVRGNEFDSLMNVVHLLFTHLPGARNAQIIKLWRLRAIFRCSRSTKPTCAWKRGCARSLARPIAAT